MNSDQNLKIEPTHSARPWSWVPTLYIAEGFPLVMVTVVSTIMYTRLGASLSDIGFWTSWLGFAWVIKPLWGPLVDLYWTKRRWAILMQILIGLLLGLTALLLNTDWWWSGTLGALALVALFSATHDIAADGFYMDALNEKQQSFFVGIRSTFYRIAMIFGQGILLIIAGNIEMKTGPTPTELIVTGTPASMTAAAPATVPQTGFVKFEPATLSIDAGSTASVMISLNQQPKTTRTVTLRREASSFLSQMLPFGAEQQITLVDKKDEVLKFNTENWNVPREVVISVDANLKDPVTVPFKAASGNLPLTWAFAFGGIGLLMAGFGVYHMIALPKPRGDGAAVKPTTPFIMALGVILLVVAIPVVLFKFSFDAIFNVINLVALRKWGTLPFNPSVITFASVLVMVLVIWLIFRFNVVRVKAKRGFRSAARVSHVPFDEVFASFFARPGIGKMVAFLLLYRLGEGLLVKMSGPFLIKPIAEGGMGLSSAEYGLAYGTFGILALTLGGILGGLFASRHGLKRWILPMCLAINVPDLFYVYLAYAQPTELWKVFACVAGESFGYGFGFTAYMLYMLYIADTGEHKTSHFALCTGFMALGMMLPGMVSGDLAQSLGWPLFFVVVCIATIPGFLMLPIIPLDKEFGRRNSSEKS